MERLWPGENEVPTMQFYRARDIEDMINSRAEVACSTIEKFLSHYSETGELSFMVGSDNLLERVSRFYGQVFGSDSPYVLVDKNHNPALYLLPPTYIFLSRVQHLREKDREVKSGRIILFDSSGQVEVSFPDRIWLKILRESGKPINPQALRENDWQSDVVLNCCYTSGGDKYTLYEVVNRWAQERQEETIKQLLSRLAPKFTG